MLVFLHLLLTPSLLWIPLLTIIFLLLASSLLLRSCANNTTEQAIMPSPEWSKQTNVSNMKKFYRPASPLKSISASKTRSSNGSVNVNGNGIGKLKNGENGNGSKKSSSSGNSSSDDCSDRSEHAPRVVAVAMKDNRLKVSCQPPPRNLSPGKQGKDLQLSNRNKSPQRTIKVNSNGAKSNAPHTPVSLGQILKNGSSKREKDVIEKAPRIPRSKSLVSMTQAIDKKQQVDRPLFSVSTLTGSVNDSRNNLSTIIAVSPTANQDQVTTISKHTDVKPVKEDVPFSSTIISINCESANLKPPPVPPGMRDFNGKSQVWKEIKEKYMRSQPSANTKVRVSSSSDTETPPPIPPLPVALRTKFFDKEGKLIMSKESSKNNSTTQNATGKTNGKTSLPLNRLCLHPKIKLKSLNSSPAALVSPKPSKIPKLRPSPTGLRSVDCLVSLYEDGIKAEQKRKEIQKEAEQKRRISLSLKQSWEELFRKYEALEKECDSISSITSSSDCSVGSYSSKSVNNLSDFKKTKDYDKRFFSHNPKSGLQNGHSPIKKFQIGRLKSAPSSLLHLQDAVENDKKTTLNPIVSRTNSEVNLCNKSVKEQEWPRVLGIACTKKTKMDKEENNNNVQSQQSESVSIPTNSAGTEIVPSTGSSDTGGIGVVRANTGRQVSNSRYRTELEIFFRSGVLAQLEAQRDEKLTDNVVRLQARCRGYLARRKLNKLKIQDLAVRCIQRNVRKFMSVRDWPWWRLLVRVTPLLNVHRTEEELKIKTEELEQLRAKVEKLEQERTHLKHDNDRLEGRLSEMTADLAEEHSTSTLATERLEAETADRLRLEKELQDTQAENKSLQQASERLEMELLYMRAADVNGGVGSDEDDEGEGDAGVYKQRYERTVRELEFTRRRLQQQHEDDLEQLVGLKKQLEKKLADAFEEVEEQRQVVGQWKRKVQKLTAETNDLRLLLEEQNSRNHLLEKKQRKFDSELQLLQDELRQEKQLRDRIAREKELIVAEKYSIEQNLSGIRLELELKEEKVVSLARELDELTFGGKTEEEVAHLKKAKHEMDKKLKEQEEELDDLAGQVQLLEQAKLRLEMSLEQQRKENRRELAQRDEELEDVRCNAHKKVKALEAQLESEHEERTQLLREKHELERRLGALEEAGRANRATDEDQLHRLRRDLRRTKALLRDAQTQLERSRGDSPGKAILRQLRNQLEDLEVARAAAVKARQSAEMELTELQAQLDEAQRVKGEAEERAAAAVRERSDIRTQLEENEEELAEVLKKYRAAVQQLSVDQMALQEQAGLVAELESERASLKEQLAELSSRLESIETQGDTSSSLAQRRLELRTKELESRLELEQTTRARMEVQISRLKETVEKLQAEAATARAKEQTAQDAARKLQRSVRELKEEASAGQAREAEAAQRRKDLEKRLESAEAEAAAARGDLRLALTRIQDLQSAIQGELEDCSGSDHSESDQDSDCSDESINTFLSNHKMHSNSSPRLRAPLDLDIASRSLESPTKVCANMKSDSKESFA